MVLDQERVIKAFQQGSSYSEVLDEFLLEKNIDPELPDDKFFPLWNKFIDSAQIIDQAYKKYLFPKISRVFVGEAQRIYDHLTQEPFTPIASGTLCLSLSDTLIYEISELNGEILLFLDCEERSEGLIREAFLEAGLEINSDIKWETL